MVNPEPTFRSATKDDALCVSVLAAQVFVDTYATLGIREAIAREVTEELSVSAMAASIANSNHQFIVAEVADHLLGFVQLKLRAENTAVSSHNAVEVVRLYVLERFASSGIGTGLLTRAETLAVAHGAQHAWLTAWVGKGLGLWSSGPIADSGLEANRSQYIEANHLHRIVGADRRVLGSQLQLHEAEGFGDLGRR